MSQLQSDLKQMISEIYLKENIHRWALKNGTGMSTKGNCQLSLTIKRTLFFLLFRNKK